MNHFSDFPQKQFKSSSSIGNIKVKILVTFSLLLTTFFFAQLVFANNLAVGGQKLSEIEKEIQRLQSENTTLKVEIAKESSLSSLSINAKKMGFVEASNIITP